MSDIHLRIVGRVQGVGYRAWCLGQAQKYNLVGFVRNRRDRTVEVFAQGNESDIVSFITACRRGPVFARVDELQFMAHPDAPMPSALSDKFQILPTV